MVSSAKSFESSGLPQLLSSTEMADLLDICIPELYVFPLNSASNQDAAMAGRLHGLREILKNHLKLLLSPEIDESVWLHASRTLAREHARHGIALEQVSENYRIFARDVAAHIAVLQCAADEAGEFFSGLCGRLFRDLSMQAACDANLGTDQRMRDLPTQLDQLLLTMPSSDDLYPKLTEFLCKTAGVDGAWIARPDRHGLAHPYAVAGEQTAKYLAEAPIYLLDYPEGPLALGWITGKIQFVANLADSLAGAAIPLWQQRGLRYGWRSACAIPISGTVGQREALVLYSHRVNFFTQEDIRLLVSHLHSIVGLTLERLRLLETLEEHRQTLALYKAAMDSSHNGILISDALTPDLPICYANPAVQRITGYTQEETLGRNCRFLQGEDRQQPPLKVLRDSLRRGAPCTVEIKNYRKDGSMFWNSLSIAPVQDEAGLTRHFVGVQNDITSLKNLVGDSTRGRELYRSLMSAAELVVRAQNERELLDELCRRLVEGGLFSQAWIGRPNSAGDLEIQSIFSSLDLKQPWYMPNVFTGDEDRVLTVRAWRQSKIQYTNDRLSDPEHVEIQDFYRKHGLRATAVVPLYRDGDLWALLTLLSSESNIFNSELLELLERIGRLIGHGLDSLDLRLILEEERKHQSWLARHDPLTDILNRRGVLERLEEATSRARRHNKILAVAVLDLDGFKVINDLHGHSVGDLLLRTIADRLQFAVRQTDAVGRLGSDEFVIILEDMDEEENLEAMLSRIHAAVESPIVLPNERVAKLRGSIGVTLFPHDDSAPERLLRHADRALYAQKENKEERTRRWMIFQAREDEQKHLREKNIRTLFHSGNLRIHYQPMINLQTGAVTGVEALARLATSENTLLSPAEFIPQLTASDLILLTSHVLAQSIEDLRVLDKDGVALTVGINFEPVMLADPKAMLDLRRQVENSGLNPSRIVFEMLEGADTLSLSGAQEALHELKSCGVRVALDDVGSAYSSLLRVKELPVDVIKLDRSFLIGLEKQPNQLRFMMNLVHLLQSLGLSLVVEGIECGATRDALAALGARYAQGYDIARPMAIEDLRKWLKRYKPVPWTKPTSVLGAVALQLSGLDATERILQQRPAFLSYMVDRDPDTECDIGSHLYGLGPIAARATAAHRAWHSTMASLSSSHPEGVVDPPVFHTARTAYEEELFEAALEAHATQQ